jgi:hypothetical protein
VFLISYLGSVINHSVSSDQGQTYFRLNSNMPIVRRNYLHCFRGFPHAYQFLIPFSFYIYPTSSEFEFIRRYLSQVFASQKTILTALYVESLSLA